MKNLTYLTGFLSLIFLFVNCSNPPSKNEGISDTGITQKVKNLSEEADITTDSVAMVVQDTIPVDTFRAWVKNWKNHGQAWVDSNGLKYFNMPLIDLEELYSEAGVDSSRFYLGMEMQNGSYIPKLILVGIDSTGDPMTKADQGQYVYDLTKACPPYCKE